MILRTLTTVAIAATALFTCATAAAAQEAADNWSFAFGAYSDNRSKGVSKTNGDPYGYADVEWQSDDGLFYVSPQLQSIDSSGGSNLEAQFAAGARPEWAGFKFDLSATYKIQVDSVEGYDDDTWEFGVDAKRAIGPAKTRLRFQYSPDSTGTTEQWTWVEGQVGWEFTDKLEVSAALGYRDQENSIDYTAYNIGAVYALTDHMDAEVRWYGTDVDNPSPTYADQLVAGISFAF
ncbi:TorF family putative porin [Brevundimonas lenta]|uniref:Uncharacterized protein (TIGR02001 family) n=1 Tax=Brevundimonas lenta TaxID=424796 RepID=A0A7W6NR75_9CAUL|nr:TorF family putative porin [Brevundimonas lenta]MBB4084409.1 uncharacterized protein (TIGR02001 family) [Brevundimonas lenta]